MLRCAPHTPHPSHGLNWHCAVGGLLASRHALVVAVTRFLLSAALVDPV
jgi:hypothetical protein